ncbi:hypothetical protein GCM10020370_40730 [Paenibacillus hodogayensis]
MYSRSGNAAGTCICPADWLPGDQKEPVECARVRTYLEMQLNYKMLGITQEQAKDWEDRTEFEFDL